VSFFLPVLFSSVRLQIAPGMNRHRSTLSRRVLRQGCAFWGLEYLIFTFMPIFHQKSSKLARNRQFQAKMLKHEIQDISEITQPNAVKI